MIYWDNGATTWPKPRQVVHGAEDGMTIYGANPGRGGHRMGLNASEQVYACRETAANFFGLSDPTGVIFTAGCTASLNMVIQGILRHGGSAVISDLEHNAVWRPLYNLPPVGKRYTVARYTADEDELVENFRRAIREDTRLMVCTHASNVFGVTLPIRRLAELAHKYGLYFCVDAAQTAGILPLDMEKDGIDYLCVAGHKGLYAPMGIGLLLCRERSLPPLMQGGTGSYSRHGEQPRELPDRLESGTPNLPGICGLRAGLEFVQQTGREQIYAHELALVQRLYDRLQALPQVKLYTKRPQSEYFAPVLSMNVEGMPSEQLAEELDGAGIAVRAGLHCAPLAHRHFGTIPDGTVRFVPSAFSTAREVEEIMNFFKKTHKKDCT